MNVIALNTRKILLTDVVIFLIIYMIPTLSHLLSFPLYHLDPMRIAVLGSVIFLSDKKNGYVLALTLPIFSCLVGGHPIILKSALIAIELTLNLVFLFGLEHKFKLRAFNVFLSIMLSKCVYYILKFAAISSGLLHGDLFATNIALQIVVAVVISVLYWGLERRIAR